MQQEKQLIKDWLKDNKLTREWLAEHCCVEKRTVDKWLSTARPIPIKSALIIRNLMQGVKEKRLQQFSSSVQDEPYDFKDVADFGKIFVTLPEDVQKIVEEQARLLNIKVSTYCSLAVEYCATTPDGQEILDEIVEELERPHEIKPPDISGHHLESSKDSDRQDSFKKLEQKTDDDR